MMPVQLSQRLREWRNDQEILNYRSGLIAHCVLVAAAGKKAKKVPKPLDFFGGKQKPKPIKDPKAGLAAMKAWAEAINN